jgi:hypothetical protein
MVNGIVIDEKSKNPIAYATVHLIGKNIGTVTNEKGLFSIYVADTLTNSAINFSCIGYTSKTVSIREIIKKSVIELQPAEILLSEIDVVAFSEKTMEKMLHEIVRKYRGKNTIVESKIFCAIESTDAGNNVPLEVVEAFYAGKVSLSKGISDMTVKNGRIAINTMSAEPFMNLNITDLLRKYTLFEKGSLHGLPESPFQRSSKNILTIYTLNDNGLVYDGTIPYRKIEFSHKNKQKCSGHILLNDTLNTVKKISLQYQNVSSNLFVPLNKNDKIDSLCFSIEFHYKHNQKDISQMLLERINLGYICLYFQSSSGNWRRIKNETFLLCYDYENRFDPAIFSALSLTNDYMRIMANPFNEQFWEVNYFISNNEKAKERIDFFNENGLLLNFAEGIKYKVPFITNNFIEWGEKRLQITDFQNNSNIKKHIDSPNYKEWLNYTSDLYHFDIQIYLDYFEYKGKCAYTTKTLFNTQTSHCLLKWNILTEMYVNLYFSMYELARRRIASNIDKMETYDKNAVTDIYDAEVKKLQTQIRLYNKDTKHGTVQETLLEWESLIKDELSQLPNKQ